MSQFPPPGFLDDPVNEQQGSSFDTVLLFHKDGVPWHDAKLPHRLHRCTAQTVGVHLFRKIERCACGASRADGRFWSGRNQTRKGR